MSFVAEGPLRASEFIVADIVVLKMAAAIVVLFDPSWDIGGGRLLFVW